MQQHDYDAFFTLLESTAQLYGKELSATVIELWFRALQHHDLDALREGLNRHIQNPDTGQFMPKPADVIRMLGGSTQDSALLAWSKVDRAVRGIGTYESVVFDDPIIHAVLADMGGWVALGRKLEKEWPFVAREFENRYRGYKTLGKIEHYPPVLEGITQMENKLRGSSVPEPMLIGNKHQAMQTRKHGREARKALWHRAVSPLPKPQLLEVQVPDTDMAA